MNMKISLAKTSGPRQISVKLLNFKKGRKISLGCLTKQIHNLKDMQKDSRTHQIFQQKWFIPENKVE